MTVESRLRRALNKQMNARRFEKKDDITRRIT